LLAKNAADTETIVFPANQIYHMELQITGLVKAGQTPDLTRNEVATGYVVVPEFPTMTSTIMIIGGLFAPLVISEPIQGRELDYEYIRVC
jgi:hypothetical protein